LQQWNAAFGQWLIQCRKGCISKKKLKEFNFNNDARFINKTNFIKAYKKAREAGLTEKNIQAAFRITGNWLISRRKALMHPEIQSDDKNKTPEKELDPEMEYDSKVTSKTSRQIRLR
jgi:hypothetical protein